MNKPKKIAITGAAGQIAYSLIFRIASGELLGKNQPISLHLLEVPEAMPSLEGVLMELEDCAFPLLQEIVIGSEAKKVFQGVDLAFLVGAKPRGPGMERKDLLGDNGKIFFAQGAALNEVAAPNCITLVVGNPCNTNCLIAASKAPKLGFHRFFSMTRLDQNRAVSCLAKKSKVAISDISKVIIWGNHSSTQVPDFEHAIIGGVPALSKLHDPAWYEKEFLPFVQKRGAAVIAARGKSSAASAANAAIDAMRSILEPTKEGSFFSMGVFSANNPYGIEKNLFFSFPCRSKGDGKVEIVPGLHWSPMIQRLVKKTEEELIEERTMVGL